MHKQESETPSQRALRRALHWVRICRDGRLHKAPALTQAQMLVLAAVAGVIDNSCPHGPLTGPSDARSPRLGPRLGVGPTVWSLSTITGMSRRWAGETLRWLAQPLADASGRPLDLRGEPAPDGQRVARVAEAVKYVPFVTVAGGGVGGGRRNRIWLHPAFFELGEDDFDCLTELPPWPRDPRVDQFPTILNGNSVPIQSDIPDCFEWELSSHKPEKIRAPSGRPVGGDSKRPPPTRARARADSNQSRPAEGGPVAPPGAVGLTLTPQVAALFPHLATRRRVEDAAAGACGAQLATAEVIILARAASGRRGIEDFTGWTISIYQRAAREELAVTPQAAAPVDWTARGRWIGWSLNHPTLGRLVVQPEPWVLRGPNGTIAGAPALKVWEEVEARDHGIALQPPERHAANGREAERGANGGRPN